MFNYKLIIGVLAAALMMLTACGEGFQAADLESLNNFEQVERSEEDAPTGETAAETATSLAPVVLPVATGDEEVTNETNEGDVTGNVESDPSNATFTIFMDQDNELAEKISAIDIVRRDVLQGPNANNVSLTATLMIGCDRISTNMRNELSVNERQTLEALRNNTSIAIGAGDGTYQVFATCSNEKCSEMIATVIEKDENDRILDSAHYLLRGEPASTSSFFRTQAFNSAQLSVPVNGFFVTNTPAFTMEQCLDRATTNIDPDSTGNGPF
jgi:hypothetical protein